MEIFHHHPSTGEFLGKGLADRDPLKANNWLVPANAVALAPPTQVGKAAVWSENQWTLVDDHRGETWFMGYGNPFVVSTLEIPEGATQTEPVAPSAPPRTIAGAYFRAALTNMGEIARVRAALSDPIDLELFNTATLFDESAADVIAVATALSIELATVFDAAEDIRTSRGG
ncbi:hypothetical protein [Hoeflea alexandrii]|uniref:Phage tail protein n=1 Tax=Hoeflea alexandrii TaxID=288436 RepID=A0ABT1CV79_9HYPH|nr:hypothetical protein [Hoeflea alexandrii]MCO6410110.1 hypothetical protein [Hoeflea alexandrii]MCY0153084.1 hypothetical protein [Hoeflea alexandrii]